MTEWESDNEMLLIQSSAAIHKENAVGVSFTVSLNQFSPFTQNIFAYINAYNN